MKKRKTLQTVLAGLVLTIIGTDSGFGQGFVNLDFESATIVPIAISGRTFAEFGPAFPGWSAYRNSSPLSPTSPVTYNDPNAGLSALGLLDAGWSSEGVISDHTALLQGGTGPNEPAVSLAQTGQVPPDSQSLRFMAYSLRGGGGPFGTNEAFLVSMNGQSLSYLRLQDFGDFRLYAADISPFGGQTVELRFTQPAGQTLFDNFSLDNISFSPNPVPEPSTWALLALGSTLFWCAARRRRK